MSETIDDIAPLTDDEVEAAFTALVEALDTMGGVPAATVASKEDEGVSFSLHYSATRARQLIASRAAIEATTVKGDGLVEIVELLREGEWWQTIVRGPNPTPFTRDMTHIAYQVADTITTLKGKIERLDAELEPFADYHGDIPDYDHRLRPVFESGIQYAVNLLAKELHVDDWEICDGTEEFDGDLGGTLLNIVIKTWPKDEHGDWIDPRPHHPPEGE